jgi:hypothetical protein
MFTFPDLHNLIASYRNATSTCDTVKMLTPSMLLGSRKGSGADRNYKIIERSLKAAPDNNESASSFWKGVGSDYGTQSVLLFLNSKRDSPFVTNADLMQFAEDLGKEDGYYWRTRGNQVDDLSRWRVISAQLRGFKIYCEARDSADDNWPRARKEMELALRDIEKLELVSADISLEENSKGLATVCLFLEVHPLGKTSAGRELLKSLRLSESEQAQVKDERTGQVVLKMALTGVLWQFALFESFLRPERREDWPLLLPKMVDGMRWTASRQWVARLKAFVEDGPLTRLNEWPKPMRRGKPPKTRHIAEFLYSHHIDGRKPDKLAEKLAHILNGREQLTFKFVEEMNRNLRFSMETRFSEEIGFSEEFAQRFDEQVSTLSRDGHVAGFADYLERTFDRGLANKGLEGLRGVFESTWTEWPFLAREVVPFIRAKWDESEATINLRTE